MSDILKILAGLIRLSIFLIGAALRGVWFAFSLTTGIGRGRARARKAALAPCHGRAWVIDGDTIAIGDRRVRLSGIDAPEMSQPEGATAKRALIKLINGQEVVVVPTDVDVYGRTVGRVYTPQGIDLAEQMVLAGQAFATAPSNRTYTEAQRRARRARIGFWANGGAVDPAIWRRRHA